MKILLTGATGLVGKALGLSLARTGHELIVLSRHAERAKLLLPFKATVFEWNPLEELPPPDAFDGVEAVIHLAGESVAGGRWSDQKKEAIQKSRVVGTSHLVKAIAQLKKSSIKTILFASAIGFYGDRNDELLSESSNRGDGFLSDVCTEWEEAMLGSDTPSIRTCVLRIGTVLSPFGGALAKLLPIFKAGIGAPAGHGKQWMSWIHIEDLVRLFLFCLENEKCHGVFNATTRGAVTNYRFSEILSSILGRSLLPATPAFLLKVIFGEMGLLVLMSQHVVPDKAEQLGFIFNFPKLEGALENLCLETRDCEEFVSEQWIHYPVENVFSFFSDAFNLEIITPPWISFKILHQSTPKIQTGTLLDYKLKLHGIPFHWQTRIEDWEPNHHFSDRQLKGPYSLWYHTHTFEPLQGGTLMRDTVLYRLPYGPIGKIAHALKVKADVSRIFDYRRNKIGEIFK